MAYRFPPEDLLFTWLDRRKEIGFTLFEDPERIAPDMGRGKGNPVRFGSGPAAVTGDDGCNGPLV
jgi:hypothetical protein